MKNIIVFGATGQTGSHLLDYLSDLEEEIKVICPIRRSSTPNLSNISHLLNIKLSDGTPFVNLVYGDVTDGQSVNQIICKNQPEEVYNFAAQSHVRVSYDVPNYTHETIATGALNVLEAIRQCCPTARYYNAGTSEQFGDNIDEDGFQRETTPFSPNSPYAVAKLAAYHYTRLYREAYGIHASNGISFNHEGPRRGDNFVTRKITKYVAELYVSKQLGMKSFPSLQLGNLEASRDWAYAGDIAHGAYLMLQQATSGDYVLATGQARTIRELLATAFGLINEDWEKYVTFDKNLTRPKEVPFLQGDASKARKILKWVPQVTFKELINMMFIEDVIKAKENVSKKKI